MVRVNGTIEEEEEEGRASTTTRHPEGRKLPQGIEQSILEVISQEAIPLSELLNQVCERSGYSRDRVLKRLIDLKEEKKISLVEPREYSSFPSFALSPSSLWFWGALASVILSLVLISVTAGPFLYLRYVFGGLLILFLPGYALIQTLYAKRAELDGLTRIALSIGLSLALVPLDGLVLNYTPFGIRLIPVAISISVLTAIFLVLALHKRHSYYKLARGI